MVVALAIAVLVVLAGLGVLALLTWRLWTLARELGRSVGRAGDRLAAVTGEVAALRSSAVRPDVDQRTGSPGRFPANRG